VLAEDGETGLNYLCRGLQDFYAHSEKPLKKVIERMRQGLSSEVIMAELRAELLERHRTERPMPLWQRAQGEELLLVSAAVARTLASQMKTSPNNFYRL